MRTVIIGLGRMGQRHIEVARSLGLPIVGVADQRADAVAATLGALSLPPDAGFADGAAMITALRPECVIVATTAPAHHALTCHAARNGARVVFCEKPMAVSLVQCDEMIAVCEQYGTRLGVNHQMRFMEQYTWPKSVLNSPEFGGITSMTVTAGNFGIAMNGTHYFEAFRYMTDEMPIEVAAWFSPEKVPNPRGAEFEDAAGSVRITTTGGKRFYLDTSADQGWGMRVLYGARFGQIFVDELLGRFDLAVRQEEHRTLPTTRYGMPHTERFGAITPADAVAPTRATLEAMLAAENFPDGKIGRMCLEVLIAAHVSHRHGGIPMRLGSEAIPVEMTLPLA